MLRMAQDGFSLSVVDSTLNISIAFCRMFYLSRYYVWRTGEPEILNAQLSCDVTMMLLSY